MIQEREKSKKRGKETSLLSPAFPVFALQQHLEKERELGNEKTTSPELSMGREKYARPGNMYVRMCAWAEKARSKEVLFRETRACVQM